MQMRQRQSYPQRRTLGIARAGGAWSVSEFESGLVENENRNFRITMAIMTIAMITPATMAISMGRGGRSEGVFGRFVVSSVVWPAVTLIVSFFVSYPDLLIWMV